MADYSINFGDLLNNELGVAIKNLYSLAYNAYEIADMQGKVKNTQGAPNRYFLPSFEKERLADAQGLAMQNMLFKWGEENSSMRAVHEENSRKRPHAAVYTNRLLVTTHRVKRPNLFPTPADYRKTNARNNQLSLIDTYQFNDTSKFAYIFLLHGPSLENPLELGFLQFAMPAHDKRYYLALSDIYKHKDFGDLAPVEEIKSEAIITLKNANREVI